MKEFVFELNLTGSIRFDDELLVRLHAAGCGDATVLRREGQTTLYFRRKGDSLAAMIVSAIEDLSRAGLPSTVQARG